MSKTSTLDTPPFISAFILFSFIHLSSSLITALQRIQMKGARCKVHLPSFYYVSTCTGINSWNIHFPLSPPYKNHTTNFEKQQIEYNEESPDSTCIPFDNSHLAW